MKITNRSKVEQTFNGITLKPSETWDSGDGLVKEPAPPKPKRGRPRKEK